MPDSASDPTPATPSSTTSDTAPDGSSDVDSLTGTGVDTACDATTETVCGSVSDLSGTWRAGLADEELRRTWYDPDFDDTAAGFVDIDVPSHWRSHPAFSDNDHPLLFRRAFTLDPARPGSRTWLDLDGICTQGDVWLDSTYLGNTDGAWVPHSFEVTEACANRVEHTLGIEVTSPPLGDRPAKSGLLGTWQDGPYVSPGWNPGGIWRPVALHRTGPVAITSHRVTCNAADATRATVAITCDLDSRAATEVTIRTTIVGVDDERRQPLASGPNTITWSVDVPDPKLWWPSELGDQPLHDVRVEIFADPVPESTDTDNGSSQSLSDAFTTTVGLRRVSLRDWTLTVNGERLFMRGVLTGPVAHELAAAPADAYRRHLETARDLGCNLVRVHGHIANDDLYAQADRMGMLIWQDLPLYRTQARASRRTTLRTARAVVDRLGAHPSIVIWCGHDEPDLGEPAGRAPQRGFARRLVAHEVPNWNRSVLDRAVKRALMNADPSRPVIGSSGTWPHPPALAGTDTHLDLGWSSGAAEDLAVIARTIPRAVRFVQITPSPSTNEPPPADLEVAWPPEDVDDLIGESPVDEAILAGRLPPDAFDAADDWHRAQLTYQAQLIRIQVETLRRLKYRPTGGVTIAHLADIRPVMSPSLIDSNGVTKPAYEALQRAYAPLLVTLDPWPGCLHPGEDVTCEVHVVSDLRRTVFDARLGVRLTWEGDDARWTFAGNIDADACTHIGRIDQVIPAGIDEISAHLHLSAPGHSAEAHYRAPVHDHDH